MISNHDEDMVRCNMWISTWNVRSILEHRKDYLKVSIMFELPEISCAVSVGFDHEESYDREAISCWLDLQETNRQTPPNQLLLHKSKRSVSHFPCLLRAGTHVSSSPVKYCVHSLEIISSPIDLVGSKHKSMELLSSASEFEPQGNDSVPTPTVLSLVYLRTGHKNVACTMSCGCQNAVDSVHHMWDHTHTHGTWSVFHSLRYNPCLSSSNPCYC